MKGVTMSTGFNQFAIILCLVLFSNFMQAQAPEGFTWQDVHSIDFGQGVNHFTMEGASAGSGGEVELRLGVTDGPVIGRVFFHHTGSSSHFMNYECELVETISGTHDVYMHFQDYSEPVTGGVLNIGEFAFTMAEEPAVTGRDSLYVYPPVPGLEPSPYYEIRVQKVNKLNAPNLEDVTNWEEPFAFFTKCKDYDPEQETLKYYSRFIGSWSHTYCNIELDKNTPIVVKITRKDDCAPAPSGAILSAAAHPAKKVDACEVINGDVYVTMSNPSQVSIDIDGQLDSRVAPRTIEDLWDDAAFPYRSEAEGAHAVSIFANPFIDKPDLEAEGVIAVAPGTLPPEADGSWNTLYFLPGVHHFSMTSEGEVRTWKVEDFYRLRSDINIYIPGDAFIYGNFTDDNDYKLTENVRIYGHGTICGTHMNHADYASLLDSNYVAGPKDSRRLRMLHVTRSENVHFEGITVVDQPHHGCYIWGTDIDGPQNSIKWAKMIGWRVNSDGMHVSKNTIIEDCFLRSQDDAVYVAGAGIRRCVFWTDVNGIPLWCVVVTGERGNVIQKEPLIVEDIDIIYGRGVFSTGAVINAFSAHEAEVYPDGVVNTGQHVYFRNINYEDPLPRRRLFAFTTRDTQTSSWAGIRFENITMQYPNVHGFKEQLLATDNDVTISHFVFDNVTINGERVDTDYLYNPEKVEIENVSDMTIRLRDTIPSTPYTLTRTATNGSVAIDTTNPGEVTITAKPIAGFRFTGWSGDVAGSDNPASIIMDSAKSVTAHFEALDPYSLSINALNGSVSMDPPGGNYDPGTTVTLKAVPNSGYVFKSWGGDISGSDNPVNLFMDSDKTVTAEFTEKPVVSVRIGNAPTDILVVGEQHQLTALVNPEDAADKSVVWSSSNTAVARVDENGLIKAISQGTATITVTTNDGGHSNSINVGVMSSGIAVSGVTLSGCPSESITLDNTYQLNASISPSNAGDLRVSWSSSNETVATVDENGWLTALSAGETTITVTTSDGGFTGECSITVDTNTNARKMNGTGQFVEVFPNPVSDVLHFRFSDTDSEKNITVFNTLGQLLFSKTTFSNNMQINIQEFNSEGMLIFKVNAGEFYSIIKIINEL